MPMHLPPRFRLGLSLRPVLVVTIGLVLIASVAYYTVTTYFPHLLDRESANPAELDRLRSAELPAPPVARGGWPQWFGPNRDGRAPDGPLRTDWDTNPPAVVWSVPCGSGYSSMAVVGGKVYTQDRQGDTERVLCLDAETGKEVWAYTYPADYSGMDRRYANGPRATPTVHDGRVYAVGAAGAFVCLDGSSGERLWDHDLKAGFRASAPTWGFASSPLIEGDLVIVQPGGRNGSVAAFDKQTGDLKWSAASDVNGYSSPVAATVGGVRQVIAVTGEAALGIRPDDGKILWRHDWQTQHNANIATPVVVGDYVFVSAWYSKGCALLRLAVAGDGVRAEQVYFRKGRVMQNHHSTCVYKDGFLYGYDSDTLRCVDLRSGEVNEDWNAREVSGNRGKGCLILHDDHLIGLTQTGSLFLADADPQEFRLRGRVEEVLSGSDCWALPVLVDGRIYLRDHEKVVCMDVRPGEGK
jgi:outer membrane protein assembly factor BamB